MLLSAGMALGQTAVPSSTGNSAAARGNVRFDSGLLTVNASNSSLNSVIHDIARATGMKISGRVPEDRVFGTYGPADPQAVLSQLLDGTGVNSMIVSNQADRPMQLVLTPRTGGATPPNPNAEAANDQQDDDQPPVSFPSRQAPGARGNRALPGGPPQAGTPQAAPANQPSEVTQPVVFAPISPNSAPSTATTTPANPDNDSDPATETVKTPQQIFEQLQKLQQSDTPNPQTPQQ